VVEADSSHIVDMLPHVQFVVEQYTEVPDCVNRGNDVAIDYD